MSLPQTILPCGHIPDQCYKHQYRGSLKDSQSGEKSHLLEILPTELILELGEHLDPVSRASFAICNKVLFELLGSSTRKLERSRPSWAAISNLEEFLKLLSSDRSVAQEHWYCPQHQKLRRNELIVQDACCKEIVEMQQAICQKRGSRDHPYNHDRDAFEYRTAIYHPTLLHIHQVLHHQLCVETLACKGFWTASIDGITQPNGYFRPPILDFPFVPSSRGIVSQQSLSMAHTVQPRITDRGNLRLTTRYRFQRMGDFNLQAEIMKLEFPLCRHVKIGYQRSESKGRKLLNRFQPHSPTAHIISFPEKRWEWNKTMDCCKHCETRYVLQSGSPLDAGPTTNDHSLSITVWQSLNRIQLLGMGEPLQPRESAAPSESGATWNLSRPG